MIANTTMDPWVTVFTNLLVSRGLRMLPLAKGVGVLLEKLLTDQRSGLVEPKVYERMAVPQPSVATE